MNPDKTDIDDTIFNLEYKHTISNLSTAVKEGNLNLIRKLLLSGKLPQTPDNRGWTCIHHCAAHNKLDALKLILKFKAKNKKYLVNLQTWEKITPLSLALKMKTPSLELVKLLLKSGASPNICDHTNVSPLHIACKKKGNLKLVKLLVSYGADVNLQDDLLKYTPLHFSICEAKDSELVKYLIDLSDMTLMDEFGLNAFAKACRHGFIEAVELFLKKDKNLVKNNNPFPPLVYAVHLGNLKLVNILVDYGADVNVKCQLHLNCDTEITMLEGDAYLPIHSSISNLEVFKFVLKLTSVEKLEEVNSKYCTFPVFLLIYSQNETYYEEILQSDLPDHLKIIKSNDIVNFITLCPDMEDIVVKKFNLFFKYNFYLKPEDVFQSFVTLYSENKLRNHVNFLYILAKMGISSGNQFENKNIVFKCLENVSDNDIFKKTCNELKESVLSLKKICRIIFRHYLKLYTQSDWLALKMVQQTNIPEDIKNFICFS